MFQRIRDIANGTNIVDVGFVLGFVLLAALSGNDVVEKIGVPLGIVTALFVDEHKTKRLIFFGITILIALWVGVAWIQSFGQAPFKYLSGKLVHRSCIEYLGEVGDGYDPIDEDGDGFLAECEVHAAGDDEDSTRIPDLRSDRRLFLSRFFPGFSGIVRPSFIDQKTRGCKLSSDAKSFELFHVGIPGGSASGYVISFQGGRQECNLTVEDRKQPSKNCPFDHVVAKGFADLPKGTFDLSVSVLRVDGGTESFQYDCQKL